MNKPIAKHEIFDYKNSPFKVINFYPSPEAARMEGLLPHWHSELEICFTVKASRTYHLIDGEKYADIEGTYIVVNSDSIHSITPILEGIPDETLLAVIAVISKDFLEKHIDDPGSIYFTPCLPQCDPEVIRIFQKLSAYGADTQLIISENRWEMPLSGPDLLREEGLILELLSFVLRERAAVRETAFPVNRAKNMERMKGVITYIEEHYREKITQQQVAERFYYTPSYFSHFFRDTFQTTFVSYLENYRVLQARTELLNTGRSVTEIALDNGFSDSRRFIGAFRKKYGITPLQYRKREQKERPE